MAQPVLPPFSDMMLDIARGAIPGMASVNKYGRATNVDAVVTDIWDRANATADQDVWVAPTAARVHALVSDDDTDDKAGGSGAVTIRVYGLTDWDTAEATEDVALDGTTPVNTVNSYVIIHRMHVVGSVNTGIITATAASDDTVTAEILAAAGQTQMAIYGVPSTQTAYIGRLYANFNSAGGATKSVDIALLANSDPDDQLANFRIRHTFGLFSDGTSAFSIPYWVPKVFAGPAIIKVQAVGSAADLDVSAGFDLVLVTN